MNFAESKDTVSIICPLHNKGMYVAGTIDSVRRQSYRNWELLVVENGSTDNGPAIVRQCEDPRVCLLEAPQSVRGPGAARNFGLTQASGNYIIFLDADDEFTPEHLQSLVRVLDKREADIAVSGWREFQSSSPNHVIESSPYGRSPCRLSLPDYTIAFAPWAIHCALIRRDSVPVDDGWEEALDRHASEDTAFWFKMTRSASVEYSSENSAVYRTHTENYRNQAEDLERWIEALDAVTATNLAYLKAAGSPITPGQGESLMRLWEEIAARAYASKEKRLFKSSCEKAQIWLNDCVEKGGASSRAMIARRLLGTRLFCRLTSSLR